MKQKLKSTPRGYWLGALVLLIGVVAGIILSTVFTPRYATGKEIEQARKDIAASFMNSSSVECTDSSDPVSPNGRVVVFYKYLRVNRYANRAVIRGCNDIDFLLAKKKDGTWVKTNVNVSLDLRASRRWQNACDIADITVTDTVTRPENASIDEMNFQECLKLRNL